MASYRKLFLSFEAVVLGLLYIQTSSAGYLEDVCMQPQDEGQSCNGLVPQMQYYFNTDTEKCLPFMYKGCGGNKNRFKSNTACTNACQLDWLKKKNKKQDLVDKNEKGKPRTQADCNHEIDDGPCRAMIPQWYYDKKSESCLKFLYGGCDGNKNRFDTEKECQQVCMLKS